MQQSCIKSNVKMKPPYSQQAVQFVGCYTYPQATSSP